MGSKYKMFERRCNTLFVKKYSIFRFKKIFLLLIHTLVLLFR